jgi:hypothetical protein
VQASVLLPIDAHVEGVREKIMPLASVATNGMCPICIPSVIKDFDAHVANQMTPCNDGGDIACIYFPMHSSEA